MMITLWTEVRGNPLLWLLVFVPAVFVARAFDEDAHTWLFVLSVLAIVPLAALLSHATESVAAKTGDTVGGLLNATLGNLTELVIALAALRTGQYLLVKASIAGAIVTNSLFMLGGAFLLGGLKHHVQEFNRANARLQASLLFLATIALLVPTALRVADEGPTAGFTRQLSLGLSVLLIAAYALGLVFSLRTHRELFAGAAHAEDSEAPWPMGVALCTLAAVTVLVALVSEVFVESVQEAAVTFGMTPAFVGFIVVALVGGAAEMTSAFAGARKNRLDLSVGIALGSASQIALFVAPVLVLVSYVMGPEPMDLRFWTGAVVMMLLAALTASLVTNSGRSAWFLGVLVLMVYLIFAMTLYLLPPGAHISVHRASAETAIGNVRGSARIRRHEEGACALGSWRRGCSRGLVARHRPDASRLYRALDRERGGHLDTSRSRTGNFAHAIRGGTVPERRYGQLALIQVPSVRSNTRSAVHQPVSDHPDA
jgi:Ca2+:H+ antiporter